MCAAAPDVSFPLRHTPRVARASPVLCSQQKLLRRYGDDDDDDAPAKPRPPPSFPYSAIASEDELKWRSKVEKKQQRIRLSVDALTAEVRSIQGGLAAQVGAMQQMTDAIAALESALIRWGGDSGAQAAIGGSRGMVHPSSSLQRRQSLPLRLGESAQAGRASGQLQLPGPRGNSPARARSGGREDRGGRERASPHLTPPGTPPSPRSQGGRSSRAHSRCSSVERESKRHEPMGSENNLLYSSWTAGQGHPDAGAGGSESLDSLEKKIAAREARRRADERMAQVILADARGNADACT